MCFSNALHGGACRMISFRLARTTPAPIALFGFVGLPLPARAGSMDADAVRIASAGHSLRWNWTPPGHSDRYGHAETLIHAPLSAVRTHVLDFGHYREMLPSKFKTSRVVGHESD